MSNKSVEKPSRRVFNRNSLDRTIKIDHLLGSHSELKYNKSTFVNPCPETAQLKLCSPSISMTKDKSSTEDGYSYSRETTTFMTKDPSIFTPSRKSDKANVVAQGGKKAKSKAHLYTPRLKMSYCSSHQITPILRNKQVVSARTNTSSKTGSKSRQGKNVLPGKSANKTARSQGKVQNKVVKPTQSKKVVKKLVKPAVKSTDISQYLKRPEEKREKASNCRKGNQFKLSKTARTTFIQPFNEMKIQSPFIEPKNTDLPMTDTVSTPNMKAAASKFKTDKMFTTPKTDAKTQKSRKRGSTRSSMASLAQKYKPACNSLLTPVRKSSRNSSVSGLVNSVTSSVKKTIPFDVITSPQSSDRFVSPFVQKLGPKHQRLKTAIVNDQKLIRKPVNRPTPYIEKLKEQNELDKTLRKIAENKSRFEMIKKKNIKRKAMLEKSKTIRPEIKIKFQNPETKEEPEDKTPVPKTEEPIKEETIKPVMVDNFLKSKKSIESKYCSLPSKLLSINELTEENTGSHNSQSIPPSPPKDNTEPSFSSEKTPQECSEIVIPEKQTSRKDTLDELQDFVKNLQNFGSARDIEIKPDEEDILDIEYFGVNRTNNSIRSAAKTLNKPGDCTLELESKKNVLESKPGLEKRRGSYSNAFMELLNSEVIENSSHGSQNFEKEKELSGLGLESLNNTQNDSKDITWNLITDTNRKNSLQDSSCDKSSKLLGNINDFLKFSAKRKLSLRNPKCKIRSQSGEQGQGGIHATPEVESKSKTNNEASELFDLSQSKQSKNSKFALTKGEGSDIFKSEISTLKDFSNLCSSKAEGLEKSSRHFSLGPSNELSSNLAIPTYKTFDKEESRPLEGNFFVSAPKSNNSNSLL